MARRIPTPERVQQEEITTGSFGFDAAGPRSRQKKYPTPSPTGSNGTPGTILAHRVIGVLCSSGVLRVPGFAEDRLRQLPSEATHRHAVPGHSLKESLLHQSPWWIRSIICVTLTLALPAAANALQFGGSLDDKLLTTVRRGYINLGFLIQTVGEVPALSPDEGDFAVGIAEARSKLYGNVGRGISYQLQVRFNGPSKGVLDARISYDVSGQVGFDVGRFKSPYSTEVLTGAESVDFVNRSQVTALAPDRQDGLQVRLRSDSLGTFGLDAGVFNSFNPALFGSAFEHSFVARATYVPIRSQDRFIQFAFNSGFSRSRIDSISSPGSTFPAGHRSIVGADVRVEIDRWLLTAEAVHGESEIDGAPETNPRGLQASVGYMFMENGQLLARWDGIKLDDDIPASDFLIAGWNWWPTQLTEIQINYLFDLHDRGPRQHAFLVNVQFGF